MNYYFYLTLLTMGEPWVMSVLFVFGVFFWCCVVWGICFICFLENNKQSSNNCLEDLAALATGPLRLVGLVGWLMCLPLPGTEAY